MSALETRGTCRVGHIEEMRQVGDSRVVNARVNFTSWAKKDDGEREKGDELWLSIAFWNEQADQFERLVEVGAAIHVTATARSNTYEKDGVEVNGVQLRANAFFLVPYDLDEISFRERGGND